MISVEARGLGGVSEVGWQGVGRWGAATERHQEPKTGEGGPLWGRWGNWDEISKPVKYNRNNKTC